MKNKQLNYLMGNRLNKTLGGYFWWQLDDKLGWKLWEQIGLKLIKNQFQDTLTSELLGKKV